ncbi:uncharacterized protein [Cicer arietinum]|uniref:uncharacterized protein isoform X2 n=1 Tax=Cicer arietinum TaxID=3827 RepID=UPI003CC5056D
MPVLVKFSLYFHVAMFLILSHASNCKSQYHFHVEEHLILLKIKFHLQNPSFLTHWNTSNTSYCSWPEITCTSGSVTGLTLVNSNITQTIPFFLCDLKNLTHVDFHKNFIPGEFPKNLYTCSKLKYLDLSMNNLVGEIPYDIHSLVNLQYLNLGATNFSGDIPSSIGRMKELRFIALQYCLFNGTFPYEIGNLLNLETLDLSSNNMFLPSKLPMNLTKLKKLKVFHMFGSNLVGEIPEDIGEMVALENLDISENNLTGNIPSGLFMLKNLSIVYLDRNSFHGEIPSFVEAMNLIEIDLAENNLTGKIPNDFSKLKKLTWLDLFMNNLSGEIPQSIGNLPSLIGFSVFKNKLSGRVPSEFENSAFDRSFLNNSGLCAYTKELSLTLCNFGLEKPTKTSPWSVGLIIGLIVVAFLLAWLASFMIIKLLTKRKQALDNSWKLISFQKLNFTVSNIVSSLTEQNIIGSGGFGTVYQVLVDGSSNVAVKKMMSNRKIRQKLESSFHAEVKILSSIRHRNIVKLLCCISNDDSMMLVYDYLENSSLDKWLHNKNKSSVMSGSARPHVVLDWPKRLKIAIGVAHGLCYMHHDCSPPIVHRDIKTSNILLDSEFNAKVADFGLAKLLMKPGQFNTMSAVIGSFGYMAPEYVQTTRVNEKIDVFSFGVILLELTTGKEATYGDEHSSLVEWSWSHVHEGSNIEELLDKDFVEPSYLDEMCNIFKLGIMCTTTLPSSRPSMKEVVHTLLRCEGGLVFGQRNVEEYDVVPFLKNSKRDSRLNIVDSDTD